MDKKKSLLQQRTGCLKASDQISNQAKQEGCVQPAAVGHFKPSAEQKAQKTRVGKDGHPTRLQINNSLLFVFYICNPVQCIE